MQDALEQKDKPLDVVDYDLLLLDEQQKLVGAFVWLVEQDKKQNPALYQINKKQKYD
jgi:hypothetical protein